MIPCSRLSWIAAVGGKHALGHRVLEYRQTRIRFRAKDLAQAVTLSLRVVSLDCLRLVLLACAVPYRELLCTIRMSR